MPLYKSVEINSQTIVKIWHINESLDFLHKSVDLKTKNYERLNTMKSKLHKRAFLSVRMLLKLFGYTDHDLFYDRSGKPMLKDGLYISITHSYDYSAVVISKRPVGVDIEKQRNKIAKIASKFLNYELNYIDKKKNNYIQELTWIWCIKECLFKTCSKAGMSFKKNFLVLPFGTEKNVTNAWILEGEKRFNFEAVFFEFDGFGFAITTPMQ